MDSLGFHVIGRFEFLCFFALLMRVNNINVPTFQIRKTLDAVFRKVPKSTTFDESCSRPVPEDTLSCMNDFEYLESTAKFSIVSWTVFVGSYLIEITVIPFSSKVTSHGSIVRSSTISSKN